LIVEIKSVEKMKGIHEAQLLTYMKLAGVKIGLLINFNNVTLKDGLKRFVVESDEARLLENGKSSQNHGLHGSRTCVRIPMESLVVPAP
jgi:hypothetical protein